MSRLQFPSMIAFDYGQTLINEQKYDLKSGFAALLTAATSNPDNVTADEVFSLYKSVRADAGYCGVEGLPRIEVQWNCVKNYLFNYFSVVLPFNDDFETEKYFLENVYDCTPSPGIGELLDFINSKCIRTCVASNLSFSKKWLTFLINSLIPNNNFEFIEVSSDCVYRKPHPRYFELLAKRCRLNPDEIWFCGDNPVCDVDGSAAAGMSPFWYREITELSPLTRGRTALPKYDYTPLWSWKEFENIIEKIEEMSLNHLI